MKSPAGPFGPWTNVGRYAAFGQGSYRVAPAGESEWMRSVPDLDLDYLARWTERLGLAQAYREAWR